ncbi:unnamed protein product [Soboliphyme baturini]|uniref:MFS domain-containing protein n=1 Tax=Soboliphyme baturini TaxID=241478 RepID=A0A183IH49_9BILA|nr:unnamed protein product [Soboliphyme baturini]
MPPVFVVDDEDGNNRELVDDENKERDEDGEACASADARNTYSPWRVIMFGSNLVCFGFGGSAGRVVLGPFLAGRFHGFRSNDRPIGLSVGCRRK